LNMKLTSSLLLFIDKTRQKFIDKEKLLQIMQGSRFNMAKIRSQNPISDRSNIKSQSAIDAQRRQRTKA